MYSSLDIFDSRIPPPPHTQTQTHTHTNTQTNARVLLLFTVDQHRYCRRMALKCSRRPKQVPQTCCCCLPGSSAAASSEGATSKGASTEGSISKDPSSDVVDVGAGVGLVGGFAVPCKRRKSYADDTSSPVSDPGTCARTGTGTCVGHGRYSTRDAGDVAGYMRGAVPLAPVRGAAPCVRATAAVRR